MKVDAVVEKYVKLRDFESAITAEFKKRKALIEQEMDRLEVELMTFLNTTGQESANTKEGTFYKKMSMSAKVEDRDMFMKFVFETEGANFLESRVNKTAVDEYVAEHGMVPPGVSVVRVVKVIVNRPSAR